VLFLDEPTIGLDITAQARIRQFLQEYNRRTNATILLTSHYMADVTSLCDRIIIIHHGQLEYDGSIASLSRRLAPYKLIGVALGEVMECDLSCYGDIIAHEDGNSKQYIQVRAEDVNAITAQILQALPVHDLTIEDPPIESIIEQAFNE
jgi:ABC-2 type transport system ATP-binding protein